MAKRNSGEQVLLNVILLILSFVPWPSFLKDGGTVKWRAFWYSVYSWKTMYDPMIDERFNSDGSFTKYITKDENSEPAFWQRTDVYLFPQSLTDHGFFETPARYAWSRP